MKRFFALRTWLLGFLFLLLCLPALEQGLGFIESGKLNGALVPAPDTALSLRGWWDGRYQELKTAWLNEHTGFHNDFIRLNNQLDYSLFGKVHAASTVLGRDRHFYEKEYLDAYCGFDLQPEGVLREKFRKLRVVADCLRARGKPLLLVLNPSQARYYPDFFPPEWAGKATGRSNYATVLRLAREYGIEVLDANGWFASLRGRPGCELMSPYGVHWNSFGATVAADSLSRRLAALLHRSAPRIVWKDTAVERKPRHNENDLENLSNLIWPLPALSWCYPDLEVSGDPATKPSPVVISDSFYWTLLDNGLPQRLFGRWQFWNYFNDAWTAEVIAGKAPAEELKHTDWFGKLQGCDAVVIMSAEFNLTNFGFGFIEAAYGKIQPL